MSRRILTCEPRQLHSITIEIAAFDPVEFPRWRKSVHNVVAYRRRRCRWWRSVGIWAWRNEDRLRGFVELGPITESEFMHAMRRHWTVSLRTTDTSNVRTEVYAAVWSRSAVCSEDRPGRYQPHKIAIEPVTTAKLPRPAIAIIEAMPVIF